MSNYIKSWLKDQRTGALKMVTVQVDENSIAIGVEGFGEKTAITGKGTPIHLEIAGGTPVLRVWSDIELEDPTHTISLKNASETRKMMECKCGMLVSTTEWWDNGEKCYGCWFEEQRQ